MADTRLTVRPVPAQQFSNEQIALIKATVAREASVEEFKLFLEVCRARGLNPLLKQIYAISRYDWKTKSQKMTIQTSVDGFRLLAQRTGKYAGQLGPWFCGEDEVWHEVWAKKEPPVAAKIGILRHDFKEPLYTVALYQDYVQTDKDNNPTAMWKKMFCVMLAKCCESLCLRRAFPEELGGMYTDAEMMQADSVPMFAMQQTDDTTDATPVVGEIVDSPVARPQAPQQAKPVQAVQTPTPMVKPLKARITDTYNRGGKAGIYANSVEFQQFIKDTLGLDAPIAPMSMTEAQYTDVDAAITQRIAQMAKAS